MTFLSINKYSGRSINFLIASGLIPVVYIIFLLIINYQNNLELQDSSIKRLRSDTNTQVATLSYFFLERKYDIKTVADSPEVETYFTNRDMGMSEQYGLKVSLFSIQQLMRNTFNTKSIQNKSIYKNVAFLNRDKKIIVNTKSLTPLKKNFQWKSDLETIQDEPDLLFKKTDSGYEILLAAPCFYKKKLSGWAVAWLNIDTLSKHFLGPTLQLFVKETDPELNGSRIINLANKTANDFPWNSLQKKFSSPKEPNFNLKSGVLMDTPPVFLLPAQIKPLPLFLIAYVPKNEILGNIDTWHYLLGTSTLIFLFLFGFLLFVQVDTKNLILKARYDEEKNHKHLLAKKNVRLKKEISKREKAELVLTESEERYRKLFESSSDAILIVVENKIVACNRKTAELLELNYEEILDKTLYDFSPARQIDGHLSKEKYLELIGKSVESPQSAEWILITSKSQLIDTEISMTSMSLSSGTYIQVIIRDVTHRKRAEEEKMLAQTIVSEQKKLALIGQVAGKMAHDFNNVLGIIMGHAEISLLDCNDFQLKESLELIFEQTLRGKNLTKNLIAFAKSHEPKQEFLIINERIDLALILMKKDLESIELQVEKDPNIPELLADPGMLEHALINLLQNSIHALSKVKLPKIMVRTYCNSNNIYFEIEDNGCGIPDENLQNIFEPSFTLKGNKDMTGSYQNGIKGTGYGMANVKKYIEQHKGTISVKSEFNAGTKITVQLPVIKKELTTHEKTIIRKETTEFNKRILLVEDEVALSAVQYRVLTDSPLNHNVDIANNGTIAIDLFNRNKYDFISLDYILPGGITGMDVYKHIRLTDKVTPILFVSGNIEFLESIKLLRQEDSYVDHISKPCQNKDYVSSINTLFEASLAN